MKRLNRFGIIFSILSIAGYLGMTAPVSTPASAESSTRNLITVPITNVIYGEPDSITEIVTDDSGDLAGRTCDVALTFENNDSMHPGTNVILHSGVDTVSFDDVEMPYSRTTPGVIHMGDSYTVEVHLGSDGVSSGGFFVQIACATPPAITVPPTTEVPVTPAPKPVPAPQPTPAPATPVVATPPVTG